MLKGTIVENSLSDKRVLDTVQIIKTWKAGEWILHDVRIEENKAVQLGQYLTDGPWYVHFWEPGSDDILVVFKHKNFRIKHPDTSTWSDAITYGVSLGIPQEQLDFAVD